jgi:hypothetical protein
MKMNIQDSGLHSSRRKQNEGIFEYCFNILYVRSADFDIILCKVYLCPTLT